MAFMNYDVEININDAELTRESLIGKVVKCTGYLNKKPIYFNCSDKVVVNKEKTLDDFLKVINGSLLNELHEFLCSLHRVKYVKGKTDPVLVRGDNESVNVRLDHLATLHSGHKSAYMTYITHIDDVEYQREVIEELVKLLLSKPNWISHLSHKTIVCIPLHLLPCILLCSETLDDVKGKCLPSLLYSNVYALSSLKKERKRLNPNIGDLVDETLGIPSDINAKPWMRNYYLSLLRFGITSLFWLGVIPTTKTRLQASILVPDDILKLLHKMLPVNNEASVPSSAWSRVGLICNIESVEDIPLQLLLLLVVAAAEVTTLDPHKLYFISLLETYNNENSNNFPLQYASVKDAHLFFSDWIHKKKAHNYNKKDSVHITGEWIRFFNIFNQSSNASDYHKKSTILPLINWAIGQRQFSSPWDIKPTDLKSAGLAKPDTFYYYINKSINKATGETLTKKVKNTKWSSTSMVFKSVVNDLLLEGEANKNPFKDLNSVNFSGVSKSLKTHRKRISQSAVNVLLDILYSPDDEGTPTQSWAIERSLTSAKAGTDHVNVYDEKGNTYNNVFCPTRTNALILLLLLPLRGVQVRWLDRGYLDATIYSPEKNKVCDNSAKQKYWKNELQYDHIEVAGTSTGVIQFINDDTTQGKDDFNIYVNSNKTQLWNPSAKNGYLIPWPYLDDDSEKGETLNRPYEVLFSQQKWMNEHFPNPVPISYVHVTEDKGRVTDSGDVIAKTPFFTPLFVDPTNKVSYELKGNQYNALAPISKRKITSLFNDLCIEAEKRCREKGLPYVFTKADNTPLFDVHSLRVAGISNLIEAGVPIHIVSEFVVGHETVVMTMGYFKSLGSEVRQRLIDEWEKDPIDSGMDLVSKYLDSDKNYLLYKNSGEAVNVANESLCTLVSVEGGLCPLGGKGCEGCRNGMRSFETKGPDEMKEIFITVQGGCGNCIHWLTGDDFIVEQVLEMNRLMLKMRQEGKEIKDIQQTLSDIEWNIDDAQSVKEKNKLAIRKMNLTDNINSREEALAPFLMGWSNRYQALQMSIANLSKSDNSNNLTLFGDKNSQQLACKLEVSSDFDLARAVVEQSTILPRHIAPIPRDASLMLREGMDKIMANLGSAGLIAKIPNEALATKTARVLASAINDLCPADEITDAIEGKTPLKLPDETIDMLNDLALSIESSSKGLPEQRNLLGNNNDK
jgi:hypothetical protein